MLVLIIHTRVMDTLGIEVIIITIRFGIIDVMTIIMAQALEKIV